MNPSATTRPVQSRKYIPRATYRLQFNRQFTFKQAAEIVSYLRELGVSDCYASPLLEAAPESMHGYDVCSFRRLNSSVGSENDFEDFIASLRAADMGLMLDVVPNHMAASPFNPWWRDVLEKGRVSAYAKFFDIEWEPPDPELRGKVLVPVLEDEYAKVLKSGKLKLEVHDGRFGIAYHESRFPVAQETLPADAAANATRTLSEHDPASGNEARARLDALIKRQHYVLAYWKEAATRINYRRFFDVAGLVSLKMESPEVFAATHALVCEWIAAGKVRALRIDHPDGLWNPKQYFERLQSAAKDARGASAPPVYVVAEKILSGNEALPEDWPVDGTTGYDFLNRVNGLFADAANETEMTGIYREFTGCETDFKSLVRDCKKQILETSLAADVNALTHRLCELAEGSTSRNLTFDNLRAALVEIIAAFPVYRTYVNETSETLSHADRASVERAISAARQWNPSLDNAALEFIERNLLLEFATDVASGKAALARRFVMRFQQLTGPAMAKGMEDTAFYRFNRLVSLNEVGGNPATFGASVEEFHSANVRMAQRCPHTLLATATHDTKRGEDVRARLNVLSEMPGEWRDAVLRWRQMNAGRKSIVNGKPAPSANDEYLFYQSLVGAWPFGAERPDVLREFRERVSAFMLKAIKEAKMATSWMKPNSAYEEAVRQFIEAVLEDVHNPFFGELQNFSNRFAFFGALNSLSQTLLKITSPGVPDIYQGTELWDLSFVDPDNRRPVAYDLRKKLLSDLQRRVAESAGNLKGILAELFTDFAPGRIKLFVLWRALELRRRHAGLFENGGYVPLRATGARREHVCAFARMNGGECVITIAPRLVCVLANGQRRLSTSADIWSDTGIEIPKEFPADSFRNAFTGELIKATRRNDHRMLELHCVFESFPIALLEGQAMT